MKLVTMVGSDPEEVFVFQSDAARRGFAAGYTTSSGDHGADDSRAVLWPEEKGDLTANEARDVEAFVQVAEPQEIEL